MKTVYTKREKSLTPFLKKKLKDKKDNYSGLVGQRPGVIKVKTIFFFSTKRQNYKKLLLTPINTKS